MLKCINITALLLLLASLVSCSNPTQSRVYAPSAPGGLKAFAELYLHIHEAPEASIEDLLQCFCWEQVSIETREAITRSLYFDLDTPIQLIQIETWEEKDIDSYFSPNTHPNLNPEWIMHIHFETQPAHMLSLPVGKSDQGYRIINPIFKTPQFRDPS